MTIADGNVTVLGSIRVPGGGGNGHLHVVGTEPSIYAGDDLTIGANGELSVAFVGGAFNPFVIQDAITAGGTLSVSSETALADGVYAIATSVNKTAVSGYFSAINWHGAAT